MRAGGPSKDDASGEWHMHCHVLQHTMTGMMSSLLIVNGGQQAFGLPKGVPCPAEMASGGQGDGMDPGAPLNANIRDTSSCTWKDDASG
jgi:hypothetical protein